MQMLSKCVGMNLVKGFRGKREHMELDGLNFEGSDINFGGQPANHLFCF